MNDYARNRQRKKAEKSGKMTPRQRRFVAALFQYPTIKAASAAVGITDRTARNWLTDSEIITALRQSEVDALAGTTRGLLRLAAEAVNTLGDAMSDGDAPASARIRAADIVLARLLQLRELVTLEERVTRLEEALGDIE